MKNLDKPGLQLISIGDILTESFFSPYQRGYRWEKRQVIDLLNDLLEFMNKEPNHTGEFYCLQPIVVTKKGSQWYVIDGQQRLTTLFLLHWYFDVKENKLTEAVKDVLRKFTYETRLSSRDFCAGLGEHSKDYQKLFANKDINDIQSVIIDSALYFLSWKYDPTIVSMSNMIDAIHSIFATLPNQILKN